jgi:hypothetical protein
MGCHTLSSLTRIPFMSGLAAQASCRHMRPESEKFVRFFVHAVAAGEQRSSLIQTPSRGLASLNLILSTLALHSKANQALGPCGPVRRILI